MAVSVRLDRLRKTFTSPDDPGRVVEAVRDTTLTVAPGELVTLLGPSGCGKTTLLRLVAGFEEATSGDIWFDDRRMNDVAPNRRGATMVFQSYAIFPHLDVTENVAFGLRLTRMPKAEVARRVTAALEQAGLAAMAHRAPNQLSGGQQQRVALARALVMEPGVLLFDEPLSNLDAKLREQMRIEIRDLQQRAGITALYVTHDQIEAMSISDRIVVINAGKVEQVGTPLEVYSRPASRFVADFIGKANFITATVDGPGRVVLDGRAVDVALPEGAGATVTAMLRPEALTISHDAPATDGALSFPAVVRRRVFMGSVTELVLDVQGLGEITVDRADIASKQPCKVGDAVEVSFPPAAVHILPD